MRRGLVLAFASLLAVGPATGQEPTVVAAVNEASNEELLSPGVLAAIFGQNLTIDGCTQVATSSPLPTELCNMQVLVNDEPAAILSASPGDFHVQLPVDAQPGPATLTLQQPSTAPLSFALSGRVDAAHELAITLETHAPGIFAVTHQDLSPISMGSPAIPGETLRITATGLGPTSPPVATGVPGPAGCGGDDAGGNDCRHGCAGPVGNFVARPCGYLYRQLYLAGRSRRGYACAHIGNWRSNKQRSNDLRGSGPGAAAIDRRWGSNSGQPCSHCAVNFAQFDYQHLRRGPGGGGNLHQHNRGRFGGR